MVTGCAAFKGLGFAIQLRERERDQPFSIIPGAPTSASFLGLYVVPTHTPTGGGGEENI